MLSIFGALAENPLCGVSTENSMQHRHRCAAASGHIDRPNNARLLARFFFFGRFARTHKTPHISNNKTVRPPSLCCHCSIVSQQRVIAVEMWQIVKWNFSILLSNIVAPYNIGFLAVCVCARSRMCVCVCVQAGLCIETYWTALVAVCRLFGCYCCCRCCCCCYRCCFTPKIGFIFSEKFPCLTIYGNLCVFFLPPFFLLCVLLYTRIRSRFIILSLERCQANNNFSQVYYGLFSRLCCASVCVCAFFYLWSFCCYFEHIFFFVSGCLMESSESVLFQNSTPRAAKQIVCRF